MDSKTSQKQDMSEHYSSAAQHYDTSHTNPSLVPNLVRGFLAPNLQLDQIHVLDIGSGTGSISKRLKDDGVGRVTLMEPCAEMLNISRQKFQNCLDQCEFRQEALPELNFPTKEFHVVLLNEVVHFCSSKTRIDEYNQNEVVRLPVGEAVSMYYSDILKSLKNVFQVLKSGGLVILSSILPHQIRYCRWYANYLPIDMAWCYPRQPDRSELEFMLKLAGFQNGKVCVDVNLDSALTDDNKVLANPKVIEEESWRVADSTFSLLSAQELTDFFSRVRDAHQTGELEKTLQKNMYNQQTLGTSTYIIARK